MDDMDASTSRTTNIRRLVAAAGGPAEWAKRYGGSRWTQPQVSQWISETSPKGIGGRLARDLETVMGLEPGSLDLPPALAQSQPVGLDLPTLTNAIRLLELVAEIRGTPAPAVSAESIAIAYETVMAADADLDESNVLDFMRAYVARLDQRKGDEDGIKRGKAAGAG